MTDSTSTLSSIVDQITARLETLELPRNASEIAALTTALNAILDHVEREHRLAGIIGTIQQRVAGRESA